MADFRVIDALVSAREELHKTGVIAGNFAKQHPDTKNAAKIGLFSDGVKEGNSQLDVLLRTYGQQQVDTENAGSKRAM